MTVRVLSDRMLELAGDCASEDADDLLRAMLAYPAAVVDWRHCTHAHSAVVQVLFSARLELVGPPAGEFLEKHIAPLLMRRALD
ncbi:MAG: hypothetical protein ABIS68_10000 [Casimicrobiaceae bacterium]